MSLTNVTVETGIHDHDGKERFIVIDVSGSVVAGDEVGTVEIEVFYINSIVVIDQANVEHPYNNLEELKAVFPAFEVSRVENRCEQALIDEAKDEWEIDRVMRQSGGDE